MKESPETWKRKNLKSQPSPNPAIQTNWIYHFLALDCEKTEDTTFDKHESIVTKLVSVEEIERLIENGEITHSLVLTSFYKYKEKVSIDKLRQNF